jgi:hypothetical protein
MAAKLKYNEDHDALEVTIGDEAWEQDSITGEDDIFTLAGDSKIYAVCPEGCQLEGLEPNTVYELVKVTTIVAPDGPFEEEETETDA